MAERDLSTDVVLVAGGTGVLGSLIAAELDRREASLVVSGRDPGRLASATSGLRNAIATPLDLAVPDSIDATIAAALSRFGRLTGVVNAAGVVAFGPLADLERADLRELIVADFLGPLELVRAALPHLDGGFVANLTGVVAEQPMGNLAAYSAAKAGLSAASVALNRELRRRRITVLDARPPHTETGLAARPISGTAPQFPPGLPPASVAVRIVDAIAAGERQLASEAFTG